MSVFARRRRNLWLTAGIVACSQGEKPAPASTTSAPAAAQAQPAAVGEEAYQVCSTCHQPTGQGMPNAFPPLVGSGYVNGPGPRHIAIVLKGLSGPVTVNGQSYNGVMASWESLSDDQIAEAINYERSHWGNTGAPVTTSDVARIRAALASRTTPWTAAELEKAALQ